MSNLSFNELDSVSSSRDSSSLSSQTSSSGESSFCLDSSSSSSITNPSDSSLFHFPGERSLQSEEDNPIQVTMDESHNLSTSSEGDSRNQSNATDGEGSSPSATRSLSANVARMLEEIGSIHRYCENIATQMGDEISPIRPSPTVVQGRLRADVSPVEVIDLSTFDFVPPARPPRNSSPVAVIDLCTPDRSHSARPPVFSGGRSSQPSAIVDLDDPSPPKRLCPDIDKTQKRDSYKCPVCLECVSMREPVSTKCGHVFCKQCLVSAVTSLHKCPLCNKKMTLRQFSRIYI